MGAKLTGIVARGKQLGGKLGFPTANISLPCGKDIEEGVYAAITVVEGKRYEGMANVGHKPALFGGATEESGQRPAECPVKELILEVNLFGFSGDLYGRMVEVELLERIRGERKFANSAQLQEAVEKDRLTIEEYFKNIGIKCS